MTALGSIAAVTVGKRKILNTYFPIELFLAAQKSGNGFIVSKVCNGIAESVKWFLTEEEARAHMTERGEIVEL